MSLREDIYRISKEEGFESESEFVYHCIIIRAWSFAKLGKYIARAYNRHYSDIHITMYCRPFIKGKIFPYRLRKWNGYAKQKGFSSAILMFREMKKIPFSEVLTKFSRIPEKELINLMSECSLASTNRIRHKRRNYFGIKYLATAKKWQRASELMGYKSPRQMVLNWPGTNKRLAEAIGVSEQAVYYMKRKLKGKK